MKEVNSEEQEALLCYVDDRALPWAAQVEGALCA